MPIYVELSTGTRIEISEETYDGLARELLQRGDLPGTFARIHGENGTLIRSDHVVAVANILPDDSPPPSAVGTTWLSAPRQGAAVLGLDDLADLPVAGGDQ
jgi:hypothetical protein